MAVVTTISMPPMLRWALGRLPITEEEKTRLEREEFEAMGFVSNIERMLVAVDASPSGQLASRLAGLLAGARHLATTVIHFDYEFAGVLREGKRQAERTKAVVKENVEEGDDAGAEETAIPLAAITTRIEKPDEEVIAAEAQKGYGFLVIGREPASEGPLFHQQITASAAEFAGPFAIAIARRTDRTETGGSRLNILVPVTGTATSRHGAEFAIALAQASRGSVTALHFAPRSIEPRSPKSWQRQVGRAMAPMSGADAVIREIVRLGDPYGIAVKGAVLSAGEFHQAILRQVQVGRHNLIVMGVNTRPGEQLSFGQTAAALLDKADCSLMFVVSEKPTSLPAAQTTENIANYQKSAA